MATDHNDKEEKAVSSASSVKKKSRRGKPLIDPVFQRFVNGVTRAIGSTEFYEYFMDCMNIAETEIQFSNRKLIKTVDLNWVDKIEDTLEAIQSIVENPRNIIKEEELIVNVAHAKKANAETVRHLAQHSGLVEDFNYDTGDVRPSKLMQRYREDSVELYENRIVFTTMEYAFHFVKIRYDALTEAMGEEFGAKLKVETDFTSATEDVHFDMFMHIKQIDSALDTEDKNSEVFSKIAKQYRMLSVFMNSQFAQQMAKLPRVKGKIVKTNVLKKNPNYRKILQLFEYLKGYTDIGYTIKVIEQNPATDDDFREKMFRNVLFNYLILKGHLQDEEDRELPLPVKERKRTLKPKFIHQIIEELTEDYDLPDVEIRKVLIEELTKKQLMEEEKEERRRLVEEQAQRKKAEQERIKAEKKAEQERIKKEKEVERELKRQQRILQEKMEQEAEDRRRCGLFRNELTEFFDQLYTRSTLRDEAENKELPQMADLDKLADKVIGADKSGGAKKKANGKKDKGTNSEETEPKEEVYTEEQRAADEERLKPLKKELGSFTEQLASQLELRKKKDEELKRSEREFKNSAKKKRRSTS